MELCQPAPSSRVVHRLGLFERRVISCCYEAASLLHMCTLPYEWPLQTSSIIALDESAVFPLQCKSADAYACSPSYNVTVSGNTMALKPISNSPDCATGTATISE